MESLLQEINMLPGVFGCFVYTGQQELTVVKLPAFFKENTVNTIGTLLTRTFKIGAMANLSMASVEFKFDETLVLVIPLDQGSILVIICKPAVNRSLVNMTIAMLLNDIQAAINKGPALAKPLPPQVRISSPQATISTPVAPVSPPVAPLSSPQATISSPVEPPRPRKEEVDPALASKLDKITDALAYSVGPIAAEIMEDAVRIWAHNGPTSTKQLPALAILLCQEINDKSLESEFMGNIERLLR